MEAVEIVVVTGAGGAVAAVDTDADVWMHLERTNTVANGTLTFPPGNRRGQSFYFTTRSQVTNVTIDSVKTVFGGITTAPANSYFHWVFLTEVNSGNGAWVKAYT